MELFIKQTLIEKKIPKQRFYDNAQVSSKIKSQFTTIIDTITLLHKLSEDTLNISKTDEVEEIFVFFITLKNTNATKNLNLDSVLEVIDKSIPYPILFCIDMGNSYQFKIANKMRNKVNEHKSVIDIYLFKETKKESLEEFKVELSQVYNSLNLKVVYEKLLKIILSKLDDTRNIDELLELHKKEKLLRYEISVLEKKVKKERQSDKQFYLHKELMQKKEELKRILE